MPPEVAPSIEWARLCLRLGRLAHYSAWSDAVALLVNTTWTIAVGTGVSKRESQVRLNHQRVASLQLCGLTITVVTCNRPELTAIWAREEASRGSAANICVPMRRNSKTSSALPGLSERQTYLNSLNCKPGKWAVAATTSSHAFWENRVSIPTSSACAIFHNKATVGTLCPFRSGAALRGLRSKADPAFQRSSRDVCARASRSAKSHSTILLR